MIVAAAIALLPLPTLLILLIGGVVLLLALADPAFALAALILSVPLQETIQLPGGLSATQACLLLALAVFAADLLSRPEQPLRAGPIFWPLAIFIWTLALAAVYTPFSRSEALRETLRWITVALTYLLALRVLSFDRMRQQSWRTNLILACLLLAPAANGALGIWQSLNGLGPASFQIAPGRGRAFGTIGQPNSFAGHLNQAWPLALALLPLAAMQAWYSRRTSALAVVAGLGVAAGLLLGGLLLSYSRGGWVGALGGGMAGIVAATIVLAPAIRRRAWLLLGSAGALLALLLLLGGSGLLPGAFAGRVASITSNLRLFDVRTVEVTPANFAVVERMAHLQAGWNMLRAYPLLGVGPGNYTIAYEQTPAAGEPAFTSRPWYGSRGHAHNYYVHIAAESGILGAAAYLALIAGTVLSALYGLRHAPSWYYRSIVLGCGAVIAAVAVHNVFENLHVLNMGIQLGTIWALVSHVVHVANAEPHSHF